MGLSQLKWRRHGTTSAPLIGIHPNPGPKRAAKRKCRKQDQFMTPIKISRRPDARLSPEERDNIKAKLLSGRSAASIIKEGTYSKDTVSRWSQRLRETGDVQPHREVRKGEDQNENQDEIEDENQDEIEDENSSTSVGNKGICHLSQFEKRRTICSL